MTESAERRLVMGAASLSRCAPREWAEFLKAFKEYGAFQAQVCVQAPPEQFLRLQGRAQQCAALEALFDASGKTADRIVQKQAASTAVQRR